jgi:hypothetical protein
MEHEENLQLLTMAKRLLYTKHYPLPFIPNIASKINENTFLKLLKGRGGMELYFLVSVDDKSVGFQFRGQQCLYCLSLRYLTSLWGDNVSLYTNSVINKSMFLWSLNYIKTHMKIRAQ